jgi:6-phosphofructokinase 1
MIFLNAALHAVVKTAESYGIKVSRIRRGFEGLIDNDLVPLHSNRPQRLMHLGVTILKTARSERFLTTQGQEKAVQTIQKTVLTRLLLSVATARFEVCCHSQTLAKLPSLAFPAP